MLLAQKTLDRSSQVNVFRPPPGRSPHREAPSHVYRPPPEPSPHREAPSYAFTPPPPGPPPGVPRPNENQDSAFRHPHSSPQPTEDQRYDDRRPPMAPPQSAPRQAQRSPFVRAPGERNAKLLRSLSRPCRLTSWPTQEPSQRTRFHSNEIANSSCVKFIEYVGTNHLASAADAVVIQTPHYWPTRVTSRWPGETRSGKVLFLASSNDRLHR